MTDVMDSLSRARSFLFVPGNMAGRFERAHASGADVVILDLEDAVSDGEKDEARDQVAAWLATSRRPVPSMVRINPVGTPWHERDVASLRSTGAPLMVPKAEAAADLLLLARQLDAPALVPLIETPRGVLRAEEIAAAVDVVRLALGHIDLAAALGVHPDSREAFLPARGQLVMASAAAGIAPPIDGVTVAVKDHERLRSDMKYALGVGMGAKLCIHPDQIETAHEALRPDATEVAWARRVIDAMPHGGVATVDGAMVDAPVLARARALLLRAEG